MSNLLVPKLPDDVLASLEVQARRHARSPADEARAILEESIVRRGLLVHRIRRSGDPAPSENFEIPAGYHRDLRKAVEILKSFGCTEIYLFGSLTRERLHQATDLDLAVRGCPPDQFFRAYGKLMMELDHPVDLVDLEDQTSFVRHLEENEELFRVD
jgi:predicted nucleotidyltransferase